MDYFVFNNEEIKELRKIAERRENALGARAVKYSDAIRKTKAEDYGYRNSFTIDIERIINNPLYNRYTDKTQVFSFYKNDDVTRRALHVQLVSRIARNIGSQLGLNLDLIEAIALGHDIGHTPFGHEGERMLDELYNKSGKFFNHNVHSVKILDVITNRDYAHGLTLQTLDGVLCHNGEKVHEVYEPDKNLTFDKFYSNFAACYTEKDYCARLRPSTLEGCVVRVSDIIAYLGKDRIDLIHTKQQDKFKELKENALLGKKNSDFIQKLTTNLIKNSLGKGYIGFDKEVYEALDEVRKDNFNVIYRPHGNEKQGMDNVKLMMGRLYDKFYADLLEENERSSVFRHYLNDYIVGWSYKDSTGGIKAKAEDIVIDYIASMTDDYLVDIYRYYFGEDELYKAIEYVPYEADLEE